MVLLLYTLHFVLCTMHITIRFFASFREVLGRESLRFDVPADATVEQAWLMLREQHPTLPHISLMFAVNRQYAHAETVLHDGDELALIPPVSGG